MTYIIFILILIFILLGSLKTVDHFERKKFNFSIKMKIFSLLLGTTLAQNVDLWPMNYESVGRAFQTYADSRTERKLENIIGEIPPWIYGTMYRNGPAIYEWGEEKYNHFFDPTARDLRTRTGRSHESDEVTRNGQLIPADSNPPRVQI